MNQGDIKQALMELITENPDLLKEVNVHISTQKYGHKFNKELRTTLETQMDSYNAHKIVNGMGTIIRTRLGIPNMSQIISDKQYETATATANQLLEIMELKCRM